MTPRQNRILQALSSIAVGIVAFCITLPLVLLIAGILLGPIESDVLFPPELAVLILISTLLALIVAVFVGIKYYRYLEKSN